MMYYWILVLLCMLMANTVYATDLLNTILIEDNVSIKIDGDLSDWDSFNITSYALGSGHSSIHSHQESKELSATVQCFADIEYIYVAYKVNDDKLIFGEEMLGHPFWDDSVLTIFPRQKDNIPRLIIYTTADQNGNTFVEYHDYSDVYYPYLWESVGVKSSLKITSEGYCVELAIPQKIMEFSFSDDRIVTQMNFTVIDDDDGEDYEETLMLNGNFWGISQLTYASVEFVKKQPTPNKTSIKEKKSDNGYTDFERIIPILQNIWMKNYTGAEEKINSMDNYTWSKPMLAVMQYYQENYVDAIQTFKEITGNTDDRRVKLWAEYNLGNLYRNYIYDFTSAEKIYNEHIKDSNWFTYGFSSLGLEMCITKQSGYNLNKSISDLENDVILNPIVIKDFGTFCSDWQQKIKYYEEALSRVSENKPWVKADILILLANSYLIIGEKELVIDTLNNIMSLYPHNLDIHYQIVDEYLGAQCYEKAFDIYMNILNSNKYVEKTNELKLGLAKIYYFIGFYNHSISIIDEILSSKPSLDVHLESEMILYSIKQNNSNVINILEDI